MSQGLKYIIDKTRLNTNSHIYLFDIFCPTIYNSDIEIAITNVYNTEVCLERNERRKEERKNNLNW
jgi:hypothetical protein